jgi:S1/P1 Nuclease
MNSKRQIILIAIGALAIPASLLGYGPTGHEIVGGIADKVIANTPAAQKIYALTDGITLERASTIADEIKAWDKNGVDDPNSFPNYANKYPKIDKQLREFWRANPPTPDSTSATPSHHWFHYTDVPVLNPQKYADGKTGRTQWDIVNMIGYCVDVVRGDVPEDNPRKITKPVAIILLAHFVGDIHEPLHVGAEYFNRAGQPVDPDKGQAGLEDEGGNTLMLRLTRGRSEVLDKRGLKLHGFWDSETVAANLPAMPADLSREERFKLIEPAKLKIIDRFAKEEPKSWRAPANVALKNYGEFWADDILPVAREAHERLQFINVHETEDQGKTVMAGDAREKNTPDRVGYLDWTKKVVADELHKAGWRLADLLSQAVGSTSTNATAPIASPEPIIGPPGKAEETPASTEKPPAAPSPPTATAPPQSDFGSYPANYQEIVTTWMKKYSLNGSRIEWQGEPKPGEMPGPDGRNWSGTW